jgi:hypothetical protein
MPMSTCCANRATSDGSWLKSSKAVLQLDTGVVVPHDNF